ncbi:MAG: hypothetical protein BWY43_00182 [candidate division WS2 bacterium ADurb.Bin280]|uniref:Transmembrane protein (PGPGW) n=1 Tax=candidate division WS2 bacterium ADurb.Bin280 TaxID=1852829 RepID=A0A1V5SEY9_9BACT|nr:MAG: hypothetical protein BWY43_00182 [candidate division WS2 bacterium ADurb.Bin280]
MSENKIISLIDKDIHLVAEDIIYVFRLLVAFIFIVVGFIGIIFPVIPDWPLLVVGVVIMDTSGKLRMKILERIPGKYRKTVRKILFIFNKKQHEVAEGRR